ncbi:cellulase family glycosylhydrolase [Xanthomonas hyacinthi]|uniref:Beta-mannosidase n=1 Tax=Xanthomonas hyacinthi TaxID=56455 RepID=A0A2S7EZP0_9XANT|nr:cellulase family glycosylhydrolase [Xanthomonas hyacinthi]PPU98556.1 beta-mannosidase [Xanthomonas hyacinthi]
MKSIRRLLAAMLLLCAGGMAVAGSAVAGIHVSGAQLKEGNGTPLVLRGVNLPHAWYPDRSLATIDAIAGEGANSVRVVLSSGARWKRTPLSQVADIIARCKRAGLIAVLEVHDTTGYGEDGAAASLNNAADYWVSIRNALIGQEDYVIVNIGNEPFGNRFTPSEWVNGHAAAIKKMRNAGLANALMVDAPNWGQDWRFYMRDNAAVLLAKDPRKNVMFSVHMYEVFSTAAKVDAYMRRFRDQNLTLVVGEFAADHKGAAVDEGAIMARAQAYGIGYMGWSWSGNDASTRSLDVVLDWNSNRLSRWGTILLESSNGILMTARRASVFAAVTTASTAAALGCGSSNGYPVCCSAVASDPDGDGWGWENQRSCVVLDAG